jgi:hypothetical protein
MCLKKNFGNLTKFQLIQTIVISISGCVEIL